MSSRRNVIFSVGIIAILLFSVAGVLDLASSPTSSVNMAPSNSVNTRVSSEEEATKLLNYQYKFRLGNKNVTQNVEILLQTGRTDTIDLSPLNVSGLGLKNVSVEVYTYSFSFQVQDVTLDDGTDLNWYNCTAEFESTLYLDPSNGLVLQDYTKMNAVYNFSYDNSPAPPDFEDMEITEESLELIQPVNIHLSSTSQPEKSFTVMHRAYLKEKVKAWWNGALYMDIDANVTDFGNFTQMLNMTILGKEDITVDGQTVSAYKYHSLGTVWGWDWDIEDSDMDGVYDNVTNWELNDTAGWSEDYGWMEDDLGHVQLKGVGWEMEPTVLGEPNYSTKKFNYELIITDYFPSETDIPSGGLTQTFVTDHTTYVKVRTLGHAFNLSNNGTHTTRCYLALVFTLIVEHNGTATLNYAETGAYEERNITATLTSTEDTYEVYLKAGIEIGIDVVEDASGDIVEELTLFELPMPTLTDVDGSGEWINLGGKTIYAWRNPVLVASGTLSDSQGYLITATDISIPVAEVDILGFVLGFVSKFVAFSIVGFVVTKAVDWLVDLKLVIDINVQPWIYELIGLYAVTDGTLATRSNEKVEYLGFDDFDPADDFDISTQKTFQIEGEVGQTVHTEFYPFLFSYLLAEISGSLDFKAQVLGFTLATYNLMSSETISNNNWGAFFANEYVEHTYTSTSEEEPVSEFSNISIIFIVLTGAIAISVIFHAYRKEKTKIR